LRGKQEGKRMDEDGNEVTPRTDDQILSGVVPGHGAMVLGGRSYPVREASNARARDIRLAIAQFGADAAKWREDDPRTLDRMEMMLDQSIRRFSPEIEADWEHIAENATDTERLTAMAIIREVVMLPFTTLAGMVPVAPPAGNRKTKRAGRKSTT